MGRLQSWREKWNAEHPDDQAKLSEPQYAGTSSEGGSKAAEALMSADPTLDALIPAGGGGDPLQALSQQLSVQARLRISTSFPQTSFRIWARDLKMVLWPVSPVDITAIRLSLS